MLDANTLDRDLARLGPLLVEWLISAAGALVILVVGLVAAGLLSRWARRGLARLKNVDATLAGFLGEVVRYVVLVLVIVTVLAQFGVQTTSIIAALGAAGLAIGLALQGTLSNIAAGIMLLVLRPFRVGEFVDVAGLMGTVVEIGLFTTELRKPDGVYLMLPNSQIWNQSITNFTRNPTRRVEITVGIDYEDGIERARQALLDIAAADPRILAQPEPTVHVAVLNASSVDLTLWCWAPTAEWFAAQNALRRLTKERFDAEGLKIPFPQYEVSTRTPRAPDAAGGDASAEEKREAGAVG